MFDDMNNSNVSAKPNVLKKMLIEPYNEGQVNHFPLSHCKEYDRFTTVPIMGGGSDITQSPNTSGHIA